MDLSKAFDTTDDVVLCLRKLNIWVQEELP